MDLFYNILQFKVGFLEITRESHKILLPSALLSIFMKWKGEIPTHQNLMMTNFSSHCFLQRAVDNIHCPEELDNKLEDETQYNSQKRNSNFA